MLDAIVRVMETNNFPAVRDIAAAAGMDVETTARALEALHGTYVDTVDRVGRRPAPPPRPVAAA